MFSSKSRAEGTAAQAWDYLSSAMATAGESAKEAGKYTADVASGTATRLAQKTGKKGSKGTGTSAKLADKASRKSAKLAARAADTADEAWARVNAAANVLAGRKPGRPWGLIFGIGLLGVALGWAVASTAWAALERQAENEELELAEMVVVVIPTYDS